MLTKKLVFLAPILGFIAGCAHTPPPCLGQDLQAQSVFNEGFHGSESHQRAQWGRLMGFMQCAYSVPSRTGIERLESVKGFQGVVDPNQVRFLFEDRQQWREKLSQWAKKRSDDTLERAIAKDFEEAKDLKQAHETYIEIYKTKNKQAGHDVAFGLLHGWDGGKPDAFAAKTWYAKTYVETGLDKSLKACQLIEDQRAKRNRTQDLSFCTEAQP